MKKLLHILYFVLLTLYLLSCTPIDIYEKSVSVPGHEWSGSYRPSYNFIIKDTTTPYKIFLVLRHTEKYNFNNIYVNLYIKGPGQDTVVKIQKDLRLGTNETGWEGSGMDDVYEHRVLLSQGQALKAGAYTFTMEQIMREDPLKHVLNVGLRLER